MDLEVEAAGAHQVEHPLEGRLHPAALDAGHQGWETPAREASARWVNPARSRASRTN